MDYRITVVEGVGYSVVEAQTGRYVAGLHEAYLRLDPSNESFHFTGTKEEAIVEGETRLFTGV